MNFSKYNWDWRHWNDSTQTTNLIWTTSLTLRVYVYWEKLNYSPTPNCKRTSTHVHSVYSFPCSWRDYTSTCVFLNWKLFCILTMWLNFFQNRKYKQCGKLAVEYTIPIYIILQRQNTFYGCMCQVLRRKGEREQTAWAILPSATCRRYTAGIGLRLGHAGIRECAPFFK